MSTAKIDEIVNYTAPDYVAGQPRNLPAAVRVTDDALIVTTRDGRTISTPLGWFPFLVNASAQQRARFRILGSVILWDELDDGVSMETILLGNPHL